MVLTEDKNNQQSKEVDLKMAESKRNDRYPDSVNQMLKLKSNLNCVVFQRFKEKVNDGQLDEVSEKIVELSQFFEKLLEDSGYEKRPFQKRRYVNNRRRFSSNKKYNGNSNGETDGSKVNDTNGETNKENNVSNRKPNNGRNYRRNNFRRYNNKNTVDSKGRNDGYVNSSDGVKKEEEGSSTRNSQSNN